MPLLHLVIFASQMIVGKAFYLILIQGAFGDGVFAQQEHR